MALEGRFGAPPTAQTSRFAVSRRASKKMETTSRCHAAESEEIRRVQAGSRPRVRSGLYSSVQCLSRPDTLHLSLDAATRLIAAVQYGADQHDTWRGITLNLTMLDAPQSVEQTMRALMDHLRHWQERNAAPPFWAWVRETGSHHGDHAHILAAAPTGSGRSLSANLARWLRGPSIRGDVTRGTLHTRPTTAGGWLGYACKTIAPTDAATLHQQTGARVIPEKPGGAVIGQRIGYARGLGPKARGASNTSTTTPADRRL